MRRIVILSIAAAATLRAECTVGAGQALWTVQVRALTSQLTPLSGLSAADLTVTVGGRRQSICRFQQARMPLSIVIVWDTSGSMGANRNAARVARMGVGRLLELADVEDEFSMIYANESPVLASAFTTDRARILAGLNVPPKGRTALLDAICLATSEARKARHAGQAIVVFSDGGDNSSVYTEDEIRRVLDETAVPIFVLAPRPPWPLISEQREEAQALRSIYGVASRSGGYGLSATDSREMVAAASGLSLLLRLPYLVTFAGPARPEKLVVDAATVKPKPMLFYRGGRITRQ